MTEYIGSAAYLSWICDTPAAGTTVLSGDYRTFGWVETVEQYDATSGADTGRVYIAGFRDATMTYTGVAQSAGTLDAALRAGNIGTIMWYPEGTAVGKRVYTLPALVTKSPYNAWAYNAVVETSIEWKSYAGATLGTT